MSAGRRGDGDAGPGKGRGRDDRSSGGFADAVPGVRPLPPSKRAGPRRAPPRPAPPRRDGDADAAAAAPGRRFELEREGERHYGRAPGTSREILARLAAGDPKPARRIDLHGHRAETARRVVERRLREAWEQGVVCVALVHGRGRHSPGDPVLRGELTDWLSAPPLAGWVAAFASAPGREGGTGVTLVRLRRRR